MFSFGSSELLEFLELGHGVCSFGFFDFFKFLNFLEFLDFCWIFLEVLEF